MGYKTILLYLDTAAQRVERIDLAFEQAEKFDAHLVGLYAPGPVPIPAYALAEAGHEVVELLRRRRAEAAQSAKNAFEAASARRRAVKCEWRVAPGDAAAAVGLSGRYADLVIAGQPQPDDAGERFSILPSAADLVLSAGRPVLFVPYAGRFPSVGKRILIAWNASRESARALSDAMPFLERASYVDVVSLDTDAIGSKHGEDPGADTGLLLARHGIKVTVSQQSGSDIGVGEQLLSRAADFDADLIVMGAYGHSRLRERILGGATRTMLEAMTVPVLMSH